MGIKMRIDILLVLLFFNCFVGNTKKIADTETWTNSCGGETGNIVHEVRVEDRPVNPNNCTIKKGRRFNVTLAFSLDEVAESLTLSCRGKYGFITIPVLTTKNDCRSLRQIELTVKDLVTAVNSNETINKETCDKLRPDTIYQFGSYGKCPHWIPSVTIDISCTCTNEQNTKTHCVRFPCRIHS